MATRLDHSRIGHVRINAARFTAYHGVHAAEQKIGGQYEVDVDITCDVARAAKSDRLKDAINYQDVFQRVQTLVCARRYRLLETIASRLIDEIMQAFPVALEVDVRIRKLNPPIGGVAASTEVDLTMSRGEWRKIH